MEYKSDYMKLSKKERKPRPPVPARWRQVNNSVAHLSSIFYILNVYFIFIKSLFRVLFKKEKKLKKKK